MQKSRIDIARNKNITETTTTNHKEKYDINGNKNKKE